MSAPPRNVCPMTNSLITAQLAKAIDAELRRRATNALKLT
jgi:hypothetical protein